MEGTVLITGGSSGIGAETARLLAEAGMTVYCASRRGIAPEGEGIIPAVLDVNDEDACKQLVQKILSETKRLDAVVVNAGNGIAGAVEETSDEETRYQFETCLFGSLKTIRACIPVFRAQGHGRIVTTTSVAAIVPLPYQGAYSAAKAALLSLTESLAIELHGTGIQCCSVLPGDTSTGFTAARKLTQAASREDSPYRASMQKYMKKIEHDELEGMKPERIARAIVRQLGKRRMRPRVIPRADYKGIGLLVRLVPTRFKLWVIRLLYC